MIYEYAIDPNIIIDLLKNPGAARRILEAFKSGSPYIFADYPKKIEQKIKKLKNIYIENPSNKKEFQNEQQIYYVEILKMINLYAKSKRYETCEWNQSFISEEKRLKFEAVITCNDDASRENKINIKNLNDFKNPFDKDFRMSVKRQPEELKNAIAPLLHNASEFKFIDPYFNPREPRYRETYKYYLKEISKFNSIRTGEENRTIIIICAPEYKRGEDFKSFEDNCIISNDKYRFIPKDIILKIFCISDNEKQEIHNRFLLTDIGGIIFAHGTDCVIGSDKESYDFISILDGKSLLLYKNYYKTPEEDGEINDIFKWWNEPIIIKGKD